MRPRSSHRPNFFFFWFCLGIAYFLIFAFWGKKRDLPMNNEQTELRTQRWGKGKGPEDYRYLIDMERNNFIFTGLSSPLALRLSITSIR